MPQCLVASSRRRDLFINSSPMRCRKLSADVCISSISLALFSCFSLTLSVCLSVISMANRGDLFCLFAFVNNNKRGPNHVPVPVARVPNHWHLANLATEIIINTKHQSLGFFEICKLYCTTLSRLMSSRISLSAKFTSCHSSIFQLYYIPSCCW